MSTASTPAAITDHEAERYSAVEPGWPDDPDSVAEAKEHPEVLAHNQFASRFTTAGGN